MAPFKSEAQRHLLWAKHPDVEKKWAHENPGQRHLAMHKGNERPSLASMHRSHDKPVSLARREQRREKEKRRGLV